MDASNTPDPINADNRDKVYPSAFMRQLRPEYYSDTTARAGYELDSLTLEYHLETITSRNQTHDFEIFCRKLCERVICPNLRPPTGPEGGGDSKADSETYPVSDEVAYLTYVGEPNAGSQRWAFAFSAKKKWSDKVRDDVKGIAGTNRSYDRIICITSQFAPAKKRAALEDSLQAQYGIPVTIHDRAWIVTEVIDHDRKDLAFNYLHAGRESPGQRLGPTDYSRSSQLQDIEKVLSDPTAFNGMETQRATEALTAAKLARGLELPRTEIDGRFARAIRLAEQDGTHRQKLEAHYEKIWTGFWWYDDVAQLNASYDQFENMLRESEHVKNVEFLTNLAQILINSVVHEHLSLDESRLLDRLARLRLRLEKIANDKANPNAGLEAETALLVIEMNTAILFNERARLTSLWPRFSDLVDRAKPLGEFDAEALVTFIEMAGGIAGTDPAYGTLIEKVAEFVSERRSEAEGARILVKRARQLDFDQHFEIIRLLGKATRQLSKKEYAEDLIDALPVLALAYRSAGLLWAARATCLMAAATIVIESDGQSEVTPNIFPVIEVWAWISLQLRHIPDFLSAMHFLADGLTNSPLTDESKAKLTANYQQLDLAFASNILNFTDDELRALERLPDSLDQLGLTASYSALLFTLGHEERLRLDGVIPSDETKEGAAQFFTALASQPVSSDIRGPLVLNSTGIDQIFQTTILGLTLRATTTGSTYSILAAEAVLGGMEALLATAIGLKVLPHTETFTIDVMESDQIVEPELRVDLDDMRAILNWPAERSPADFEFQRAAFRSLMEITGKVLAATCYCAEMETLLEQLYHHELVSDRITMVAVASNSYSRVLGRRVSRLPPDGKVFPFQIRPNLSVKHVRQREDHPQPSSDMSHRSLGVRSIIDVHLWDRARWRGAAFFDFGPQLPPVLALMFENGEAAEKIFIRWRERFGSVDEDEGIRLTIIRGMSKANPSDYKILVTSDFPHEEIKSNGPFALLGRHMTMTPATSENLDRFLAMEASAGAYLLVPAIYSGKAAEPIKTLFILKRRLVVRNAADIGPNDVEAMLLGAGDVER